MTSRKLPPGDDRSRVGAGAAPSAPAEGAWPSSNAPLLGALRLDAGEADPALPPAVGPGSAVMERTVEPLSTVGTLAGFSVAGIARSPSSIEMGDARAGPDASAAQRNAANRARRIPRGFEERWNSSIVNCRPNIRRATKKLRIGLFSAQFRRITTGRGRFARG